ncbi:ATP-binding cassette domain-containing protein [Nocardioides maradonensis]
MTSTALDLQDVTFIRGGRHLLDEVSVTVGTGEHWALIGANGAGKTTLLNICGAVTFPSRGTAAILGHRLGTVDLRDLRRSIGFVNPRHPLESNLTAHQVVLTGATGTTELVPRWEPNEAELARAERLLKLVGLDDPDPANEPRWLTMSQGERGRVLIARSLMADPPLLLLDEPSTGLDVAAREQMIHTIADLPDQVPGLTTVMMTHHFEELPPSTTHAALLRHGRLVAAGPVADVLTSELVTATFDHPIQVERRHGRWYAFAGGRLSS